MSGRVKAKAESSLRRKQSKKSALDSQEKVKRKSPRHSSNRAADKDDLNESSGDDSTEVKEPKAKGLGKQQKRRSQRELALKSTRDESTSPYRMQTRQSAPGSQKNMKHENFKQSAPDNMADKDETSSPNRKQSKKSASLSQKNVKNNGPKQSRKGAAAKHDANESFDANLLEAEESRSENVQPNSNRKSQRQSTTKSLKDDSFASVRKQSQKSEPGSKRKMKRKTSKRSPNSASEKEEVDEPFNASVRDKQFSPEGPKRNFNLENQRRASLKSPRDELVSPIRDQRESMHGSQKNVKHESLEQSTKEIGDRDGSFSPNREQSRQYVPSTIRNMENKRQKLSLESAADDGSASESSGTSAMEAEISTSENSKQQRKPAGSKQSTINTSNAPSKERESELESSEDHPKRSFRQSTMNARSKIDMTGPSSRKRKRSGGLASEKSQETSKCVSPRQPAKSASEKVTKSKFESRTPKGSLKRKSPGLSEKNSAEEATPDGMPASGTNKLLESDLSTPKEESKPKISKQSTMIITAKEGREFLEREWGPEKAKAVSLAISERISKYETADKTPDTAAGEMSASDMSESRKSIDAAFKEESSRKKLKQSPVTASTKDTVREMSPSDVSEPPTSSDVGREETQKQKKRKHPIATASVESTAGEMSDSDVGELLKPDGDVPEEASVQNISEQSSKIASAKMQTPASDVNESSKSDDDGISEKRSIQKAAKPSTMTAVKERNIGAETTASDINESIEFDDDAPKKDSKQKISKQSTMAATVKEGHEFLEKEWGAENTSRAMSSALDEHDNQHNTADDHISHVPATKDEPSSMDFNRSEENEDGAEPPESKMIKLSRKSTMEVTAKEGCNFLLREWGSQKTKAVIEAIDERHQKFQEESEGDTRHRD